jgi:hypothetical protein
MLIIPVTALGAHGLREARDFKAFRVYFAGKSVLGLKLHDIDIIGDERKAEIVAFYGKCEPRGGGGCSYPLEIGNTSICRTYPAIYFSPPKLRRINGAWGGWVRTARIFDVYTGRTAVSIFGVAENKARHVARQIMDVRRDRRQADLPDVRQKLLDGKGRCQHGPGVAPPPQ